MEVLACAARTSMSWNKRGGDARWRVGLAGEWLVWDSVPAFRVGVAI